MNEFIFPPSAVRGEAAEKIDQSSCNTLINPHIAVDDPHNIAFGFPVCSAHVPDLRIGSEIAGIAAAAREIRIFFFHKYLGIKVGEVGEQPLEYGQCRIIA